MSGLGHARAALDRRAAGEEMHGLVAELLPIPRSITGDGLRETLGRIGDRIPLTFHEVPTGTRVLDWTVPREWNVRDAWIADPAGRRVVDMRASSLHLVSYSVPIHRRMPLAELLPHLFSLPAQPELVPYRTAYYEEHWGFCLAHRELEALADGEYEVCVDSTLADGHLTYAECVLPGTSEEEVLISCHACHPRLANDNLSGVAVATLLARTLAGLSRRLTYRFVFIPGTIGAIAWLARNEQGAVRRVRHGLVLTGVGDPGAPTYKRTRHGARPIDRAVEHVLRTRDAPYAVEEFTPWGYDERQYGSPGFDLPVGCLMRTPHGRYPEYHTSADDLDFVRPECLVDTLDVCLSVLEVLEGDGVFRNLNPKGEPQLGRRGLYRALGGEPDPGEASLAMLWVLNGSDGEHSLVDIASRSGLPFPAIARAAERLREHGLLAAA